MSCCDVGVPRRDQNRPPLILSMVAPSTMPPATSVGPSVPSESTEPMTIRSLLPTIRGAAARTNSWLRPPLPVSCPTATTTSPPQMKAHGGRDGTAERLHLLRYLRQTLSPAGFASTSLRLVAKIAAFNPSSRARRQGSGQHHVWIDDPIELIRPLGKIGLRGRQVSRISTDQKIAD